MQRETLQQTLTIYKARTRGGRGKYCHIIVPAATILPHNRNDTKTLARIPEDPPGTSAVPLPFRTLPYVPPRPVGLGN